MARQTPEERMFEAANEPFFDLETWNSVVGEVRTELLRSIVKHPIYPADPLRRTAIMVEEAGESMKEALDMTRPGVSIHDFMVHRRDLRKEVVQTAAMCMKLIMAINHDAKVGGY